MPASLGRSSFNRLAGLSLVGCLERNSLKLPCLHMQAVKPLHLIITCIRALRSTSCAPVHCIIPSPSAIPRPWVPSVQYTMAQYVNGHFVGRKAAAADPFSQSQSTVGADWPSAALELSLPTSQILHAENQHVACLGIGPGGLFEGLEDSQGQQEVAAPVQPQLNLQAPEVLQPSAMPPAAQTNTQTAMEHLHKCAEVQQWHKSLAPFDADHCMVCAPAAPCDV
eukprot:508937-Pelagomonas_calceolata.AAC.2